MNHQQEEPSAKLNPDTLRELAKSFDKQDPQVVVLVGTGVSAGATGAAHASWLGLLKHCIDHLVDTQKVTQVWGTNLKTKLDKAFSPFQLTEVLKFAELVEQSLKILSPEDFAAWLEAAFRNMRALPGKGETLDALRELELAGALLLTTNYDDLLEKATGLDPITWMQHEELLTLMTRKSHGILHIHGHWRNPNSVVLGKESYERHAGDAYFKDGLKSLWMYRHWLYVGCGSGLDDPDLGTLLEWGKGWGSASLRDYYLALADQAAALERDRRKPQNLVCIGYADHSELPEILRGLVPAHRCSPFKPVDAKLDKFRLPKQGPSIPCPSLEEYLGGEVPAIAADAEVTRRLDEFGWAFVLDARSAGKTTLALRIATAPQQREHPSFYLDLADIGSDDSKEGDEEEDAAKAAASMLRLAREETLLILDNVHHDPELARKLWGLWSRRRVGRLLMVATRTKRQETILPTQEFAFFEQDNPAIELTPTPDDLWHIAQYIHRKVAGAKRAPLRIPPADDLERWHRDFGCAVGAFCVAVHGRLSHFRDGDWTLPLSAASEWVKETWLSSLDSKTVENLMCLAVVGALEMEVWLGEDALPHPKRIKALLKSGLVTRSEHGPFGQYRRYRLLVQGWDGLILAAQRPPVDKEGILHRAATRDAQAAVILTSRMLYAGLCTSATAMWGYIASHKQEFLLNLPGFPITHFPALLKAARDGGQPQLIDDFWSAVEAAPLQLIKRAWKTPLDKLAHFLDTAKAHRRQVEWLWQAIEKEPDKFAERAWEASLESVACFLDTAQTHGRNVTPLWEALERDPNRLAEHAWETSLENLAHFLDTAKAHGRKVGPLWEAIERDPDRLVEHAWETSLEKLAHFLDTAKAHGRDVGPLWEAIERDPDRLAELAGETPLEHLASFLGIAKKHERDVEQLCTAIERDPRRLHEQAARATMTSLAGFCHYAPDRLVKVAFAAMAPTQWDKVTTSEQMDGATWVARRCQAVGRTDLTYAIVRNLLERKNQLDFPLQAGGLARAAWLLENVPPEFSPLIAEFLSKVCTPLWVSCQYRRSVACATLATGLRMLTLHQAPPVWRRFLCPELGEHLRKELGGFDQTEPARQYEVIQFLGSADLAEWSAQSLWFINVSPEVIVRLATETLRYEDKAQGINEAQFEFWLGLRALVRVTNWRLPIADNVVERTEELWRLNLAVSSAKPHSKEHAINLEMVAWLDQCLLQNPTAIVPPSDKPQGKKPRRLGK